MTTLQPYVRESGSGPGVVCIHSNASSSSQWRTLMDALGETHHVFAPDSFGSGRSPGWPCERKLTLKDEVELIEPVMAQAGRPLSLVGHSYGGAVALLAALADPGRVSALVLYEPSLYSIVDAQRPPPNGAEGIRATVGASMAALDAGDPEGAAKHFIDFWMGAGTWAAMPPERKPAIIDSAANMRHWTHALFAEPAPVDAFAALKMPVLYMQGELSPKSAHAVGRVLLPVLPHARVVTFPGVGHMGPITHPEVVNAEIDQFLRGV